MKMTKCSAYSYKNTFDFKDTFPTVKPINRKLIENISREFELIVTVEEHNIIGRFWGAVAEVMAEMRNRKGSLLRIGLNDEYNIRVENQKYLRTQYIEWTVRL